MITALTILGSVLFGLLLAGIAVGLYVRHQLGRLRGFAASSARAPGAEDLELGSGYSTVAEGGGAAPARSGGAVDVLLPHASFPRCDGCRFWGHEAGQKIMDQNAAFRAASQSLQPHQMSQKRTRAFIELEKRIYEHEKVNGVESATDLRAELAKTPEFIVLPDDEGRTLLSTWADFGLCTKHKELRAKNDKCEKFSPTGAP